MQPYSDILERLLVENVLPFWERDSVVDEVRGGYHLHHDARGRDRGPANKRAVAQVRMLWFFSAIARSPWGRDVHRDYAHHGYRFVRRALIDETHGGVFWEVDAAGRAPVEPGKHVYAQVQTVYALAEYRSLSGSKEAADLARELLSVLAEKARDREFGGYVEAFSREWSPLPFGMRTVIGSCAGEKSLNTHLHIMEMFLAIDDWGESREELVEVVSRVFTHFIRSEPVSGIGAVRADWGPKETAQSDTVSYGHDLELAWMARDARRRLGSSPVIGDTPERLVTNALLYGYDRKRGGFFESGPAGRRATARDKVWWVQAEALLALLPPGSADEEAFAATLAWIDRCQADRTEGEWHDRIRPILGPKGGKTGPWKAAYHSGRALLRSLHHLKAHETESRQSSSPQEGDLQT